MEENQSNNQPITQPSRRTLPRIRSELQIEPQVFVPKPVTNKRTTALVSSSLQIFISLLGFSIGLAAFTATENIKAGSFWSHLPMAISAILFSIGLASYPQGRTWIIFGMIFNAVGLIMSFIGSIIDGVEAGHIATTDFGKCSHALETGIKFCQQTELISTCKLTIIPSTCYCCYIFKKQECDRGSSSLSTQASQYHGVGSCQEIENRFQTLLWVSMVLCIINFIIGLVSMVIISYYKASLQTVTPTTRLRNNNSDPSPNSHIFDTSPTYTENPITYIKPPDYNEINNQSSDTHRRNSHRNSLHFMPPVENEPPPAYSP